eukprot:NODE_7_length_4989_cov_91.709109_g6_i0.p1 GENE.NODE_7_length_4989_cov_91.709109_g6_i0~~NODE_7_length_4989_cov_91.709109_g6_i0.p1  ORF type:complete len:561 (-),score=132.10 NODE_7_length_4989_cov_91.709109_g6_i0:813-2495(-)
MYSALIPLLHNGHVLSLHVMDASTTELVQVRSLAEFASLLPRVHAKTHPGTTDAVAHLGHEQVVTLLFQAAEQYVTCLPNFLPPPSRPDQLMDIQSIVYTIFTREAVVPHTCLSDYMQEVMNSLLPQSTYGRTMLVEAHTQAWLERLLALVFLLDLESLKIICTRVPLNYHEWVRIDGPPVHALCLERFVLHGNALCGLAPCVLGSLRSLRLVEVDFHGNTLDTGTLPGLECLELERCTNVGRLGIVTSEGLSRLLLSGCEEVQSLEMPNCGCLSHLDPFRSATQHPYASLTAVLLPRLDCLSPAAALALVALLDVAPALRRIALRCPEDHVTLERLLGHPLPTGVVISLHQQPHPSQVSGDLESLIQHVNHSYNVLAMDFVRLKARNRGWYDEALALTGDGGARLCRVWQDSVMMEASSLSEDDSFPEALRLLVERRKLVMDSTSRAALFRATARGIVLGLKATHLELKLAAYINSQIQASVENGAHTSESCEQLRILVQQVCWLLDGVTTESVSLFLRHCQQYLARRCLLAGPPWYPMEQDGVVYEVLNKEISEKPYN